MITSRFFSSLTIFIFASIPIAQGATATALEARNSRDLMRLLKKEGMAIVPNAYPIKNIEHLKTQAQTMINQFEQEKETLPKRKVDYTHVFDKVYQKEIDKYDFSGTGVKHIAKGRYDFAPLNESHLTINLLEQPLIAEVMAQLVHGKLSTYTGFIPSAPASAEGVWHRDTMPFIKSYNKADPTSYTDEKERADLKPQNYYFTVLIPLVDVGPENGGTAFQLRTHLLTYRDTLTRSLPFIQPTVKAGDAIVFTGTLFHQGRANPTTKNRLMLYQVWQNERLYDTYHGQFEN